MTCSEYLRVAQSIVNTYLNCRYPENSETNYATKLRRILDEHPMYGAKCHESVLTRNIQYYLFPWQHYHSHRYNALLLWKALTSEELQIRDLCLI